MPFPDEASVKSVAFRCPQEAAQSIGRAMNCRVSVEPDPAGQFAIDVAFATLRSLLVIDANSQFASRIRIREGVRCLGLLTARTGSAGVVHSSQDLFAGDDTGLVVDTARIGGYLLQPQSSIQLALICFERVDEAARRLLGRSLGHDWAWAQTFGVDTAVGRGLSALLRAAIANIELASSDPCAASRAMRLNEDALLAFILERTALLAANDRQPAVSMPSTQQVQLALDLIKAAPADLSVADVAARIGVSVRSLQLAFRRIVGATPHSVIKRARLDRARDLLTAGSVGSVQQAADNLGFSNVARFSAEYRTAFGETPLTTLRSAMMRKRENADAGNRQPEHD